MALSYALLAALGQSPMSGYDLFQRFQGSLGYFWHASHQQIYRELSKLHADGLLDVEIHCQQSRPDRKIYSITPAGEAYLVAWLHQSVEPAQHRDPLLVKLYAGAYTEPAIIAAELRAHRYKHTEKLGCYRAIFEQCFQAPTALDFRSQCIKLTVEYGIAYEENWLAWCEHALTVLS